jgi:hypothetical protein
LGKFIAGQTAVPVKGMTFESVAADYLKRHVEKERLRSEYEIKRCLNKYLLPRWKDRVFFELRPALWGPP